MALRRYVNSKCQKLSFLNGNGLYFSILNRVTVMHGRGVCFWTQFQGEDVSARMGNSKILVFFTNELPFIFRAYARDMPSTTECVLSCWRLHHSSS